MGVLWIAVRLAQDEQTRSRMLQALQAERPGTGQHEAQKRPAAPPEEIQKKYSTNGTQSQGEV